VNAGRSRFYAGGGGGRSEKIALRSHDADFAVCDLDTLGQRAKVFAPVAAVDPDALAGGSREFLDHGGRDRLLARAFRQRLGAVGVSLGLIADGLEAGDALLQGRVIQVSDAGLEGATFSRRAISLPDIPAAFKRSTSRTWRIVVLSAGIGPLPWQKPKERT
jgi:hypothetical protein